MEDQDTILNELLEKINNLEKRNDNLRNDIKNKRDELINWDKNHIKPEKEKEKEEEKVNENENENDKNKINLDENNKNKKMAIPTDEEDKKIGERFLYEIKNIKLNIYEIEKNMQEITIEYISQEQHSSLYIMGDFTKWELMPMKKNKDIFSYKVVLLKGFKYFYAFQAGDQIFIDYNNLYEENPKNSQIQNFIDLSKKNENCQNFDSETDMNILKIAQKNYFLSKISIDEGQIQFLEKFKRHIMASKEIYEERLLEHSTLTNSIYGYYDQLFKYIQPYESESKVTNLRLFFKDRIFVHYQENPDAKDKPYMYYYKIVNINNNYCFQSIKLYDNNNIKVNYAYYNDIRYYYSIYFDSISLEPINTNSKLYHLLSKEESEKILTIYNNDKNGVLKAYFKTLIGLRNNAETQNNNNMVEGIRSYIRNYGSILVLPDRVEPKDINMNDYEFQYSLNKIVKVKNKKEGSYVEYIAIDEKAEKAKKPFRYKIYYCIKDNKVKLIHCHVLDKDLRNIKILIKEIDKIIDPKTLKKDEEYIKNNQLLLIIKETVPIKLYYNGKKVKMEGIKIDENKLYLLISSDPDSIFNKMYVTVGNIEEKLNYDLMEQCNEFSYSLDNIPNGVDVTVTYDNNKNYVVEKMMLAVSPCLLQRLSTYEENQLKKNQIKELKDKKMSEMDKYFLISQKMTDFRKYNKEAIDKMEQKEKENLLITLNEYKENMVSILNYIEANEMWETLDQAVNIAAEIEDLIKLINKK